MTDQPARVTPAEISALLDQARGLTPQSPLADQIAFHERKALLLSRLAADSTPPRRIGSPPTPGITSAPWPASGDRAGGAAVKMTAFSGQQLAQVDNPDPFAPPVWRSPIYHTPGWIITIVQLSRASDRPGQVPGPASGAGPGARRPRRSPGAWPDGPARSP